MLRTKNLRCLKEFSISKLSKHKRGASRFSVDIFSSHNTENFQGGELLCSRKFLISKNSMDKMVVDIRSFRLKIEVFCLRLPNMFERGTFSFSEGFGF